MSLNAARHDLDYRRVHSLLRANGIMAAQILIKEVKEQRMITILANDKQASRMVDGAATPGQVAHALHEMVRELM